MKEIITNCFLAKISIKLIWLLLVILLGADYLHCSYLANKYQCRIADISTVVGFYWLSPVFDSIYIIIALLLFFKAIQLAEENKIIIFHFQHFTITIIPNRIITRFRMIVGLLIFIISILALMQDVKLLLF